MSFIVVSSHPLIIPGDHHIGTAIALWKALRDTGTLREALALYQERRLPPMKKILDAATASIRWYERMDELICLSPVDFAYSYMTRTGRVSHAEMQRRDPALAEAYARLHPEVLGGLAG